MGKKRANGEGSIRKRKDGRWEGFYTAAYDPVTGKQKIKNVLGKTQAEVKEKLKKAIADSQRLDMNRSGTHTVKSWVLMWYEVYAEPRLRENTKDYYLNYIPVKNSSLMYCFLPMISLLWKWLQPKFF